MRASKGNEGECDDEPCGAMREVAGREARVVGSRLEGAQNATGDVDFFCNFFFF